MKENEDLKETNEEIKEEQKPDEIETPKKEEIKEEPKKADSEPQTAEVDVEALKNELVEANKKAQEVETLSTTIASMKKDSEDKDVVIKEYEDLVGKLIETKLEQIPADFKDLIPDNLNLKQKLNWLEKAEAKGLFNKEEKKKPNVEIGKPMNVDVPQVDISKLSGSQLLKMAYNTIKK